MKGVPQIEIKVQGRTVLRLDAVMLCAVESFKGRVISGLCPGLNAQLEVNDGEMVVCYPFVVPEPDHCDE